MFVRNNAAASSRQTDPEIRVVGMYLGSAIHPTVDSHVYVHDDGYTYK